MYSLHELIIEGEYLYLFSNTGWIVIKSVLGTCFLPWSIMHQDCFNCCWRNHHEAVPNTGTCCKWLSPPLPSSRVRVHLPISVIIWGTLVRTAHPFKLLCVPVRDPCQCFWHLQTAVHLVFKWHRNVFWLFSLFNEPAWGTFSSLSSSPLPSRSHLHSLCGNSELAWAVTLIHLPEVLSQNLQGSLRRLLYW